MTLKLGGFVQVDRASAARTAATLFRLPSDRGAEVCARWDCTSPRWSGCLARSDDVTEGTTVRGCYKTISGLTTFACVGSSRELGSEPDTNEKKHRSKSHQQVQTHQDLRRPIKLLIDRLFETSHARLSGLPGQCTLLDRSTPIRKPDFGTSLAPSLLAPCSS